MRRMFGFDAPRFVRKSDFAGAGVDVLLEGRLQPPGSARTTAMVQIRMRRRAVNDPSWRAMIREKPFS